MSRYATRELTLPVMLTPLRERLMEIYEWRDDDKITRLPRYACCRRYAAACRAIHTPLHTALIRWRLIRHYAMIII